MPFWKSFLLHFYFYATLPYRRWIQASDAAVGMSPISVLMYHRVADDLATPWTVSNRTFQRQIRWLRQRFEIISLSEAQQRITTRINRRACVCITFDDGYADNCTQALPWLIEQNIPVTYFVTTENIFEGRPFKHDLDLDARCLPNTPEQIRELAEAGVEIGGHTITHADLGQMADPEELRHEMLGGIRQLEELTERPIRFFAFPFGQHENLSDAAFSIARTAGLSGVCSAYGGYNFPGDDPFHLQRIAIDDDMIRMKNWLTFDPRKRNKHPRYEVASQVASETELVSVDLD